MINNVNPSPPKGHYEGLWSLAWNKFDGQWQTPACSFHLNDCLRFRVWQSSLTRQKYPRCEHKAWKYRLALQHLLPPGKGPTWRDRKMLFSLMCFSHALLFPFVIKIFEVMRVIFLLLTEGKELIGDLSCEEWEQCIYGANATLWHYKTGRLGYTSYALGATFTSREIQESWHTPSLPVKGWTESALQFSLLQQDSHGCNMQFRNIALHRGLREMRENNSVARSCQKASAVFRNSKVSLFFCCTIRNI